MSSLCAYFDEADDKPLAAKEKKEFIKELRSVNFCEGVGKPEEYLLEIVAG